MSEVEEVVKTSCSSPHPLFTMDDVSAVDVEPVAVDVEDFLDVAGFSCNIEFYIS